MKKFGKKILSIVLSLCLLTMLLPVTPAIAKTGDSVVDVKATTYEQVGDIPTTFKGLVYTYSTVDADTVQIDAGLYNVPESNALSVAFRYDPLDVKMMFANGTATEITPASDTALMLGHNEAAFAAAEVNTSLMKAALSGSYPNLPMFGHNYSPFSLVQTEDWIEIKEGKLTGDFFVSFRTNSTVVSSTYFTHVTTSGLFPSSPANTVMPFYSMRFDVLSGASVDNTTFSAISTAGVEGFMAANTAGAIEGIGVAFVGFPKADEETTDVTITVKSGTTTFENAEITFVSGTTAGGQNIVDYIAKKYPSGLKTGTDGTLKFALPYSNSSGYRYKIKDVVTSDGTYKMASTESNAGKLFEVLTANATSTCELVKETAVYTFNIKAKDTNGTNVSLENSKITLNSNDVNVTTSAATGLTFTTSLINTLLLEITGINGYQNVSGNITVTATDTPNVAEITAVPGANYGIEVEDDKTTLVITLKPVETTVIIPVPAPTTEEGEIDAEKAGDVTVNFTPTSGGSTTSAKNLEVVDGDDDGVNDTINATVTLPDGEYTMSVGGPGINSAQTTVTILTVYDDDGNPTTIVNVGGTVTEGDDGKVTATGGCTATGGAEDTTTGNSSIDLTGDNSDNSNPTIKDAGGESGTVIYDPSTGTTTGGSDISSTGLTGSESYVTNMTPTAMTDPLYEVRVTPNYTNSKTTVTDFKVEIYLKNAKASSGTFGMYFDPVVFDAPTTIDFNSSLGVTRNTALKMTDTSKGYIQANHKGSGYVFFGWHVEGEDENQVPYDILDATKAENKDGILIAKIEKLPVKVGLTQVSVLKEYIDDRSVYTMDFAITQEGEEIIAEANGNADTLTQTMGGTWRPIEMTGVQDHTPLADEKATRGGFYQIYSPNATAGYQTGYDIRMAFIIDEELVEKDRVDFYVSEPSTGNPVNKAFIEIYASSYDPANVPPLVTGDAPLETNEYGYAHASLLEDTYYYRVYETSHWSYPDGTPNTDGDTFDYDSFILSNGTARPTMKVFPSGGTYIETPVVDDYINPRMEPKSFHEVVLEVDGSTPNASITSDTQARNGVDYYFTLTPNAKYEWAAGLDMVTVATTLTRSALMYDINLQAADSTAVFRGTPTKPLTISWVPAREQFKIEGGLISGKHIGVNQFAGDKVEPLRAGDIVLILEEEWFTLASHVITATAGTGGHVSWAADDTVTTGATDLPAAATGGVSKIEGTITETLSAGRTTSGIFSFAPSANHRIKSVTINGVDLPITEEQKKNITEENPFIYQFFNVTADQNIYVTFVDVSDPDNPTPVSDAQIEVIVGANGQAEVMEDNSGLTGSPIDGPDTGIFYVDGGSTVTINAVADPTFVVDTIMVNGVAEPAGTTSVTLNTAASETYTVAITFKPEDSVISTHVIVTAGINKGFGIMVPIGVTIYPRGEKPTYTMTPDTDWLMVDAADSGAVMVNGVDRSEDLEEIDDTNVYTYQLPALSEDTTLMVTFSEYVYKVEGLIQLAGRDDLFVKEADLTFIRDAGDSGAMTDEEKVEAQSDPEAKFDSSKGYRTVKFTAYLPKGTWDLTVEKDGYLDYTITDFKVDRVEDKTLVQTIYFGDINSTSSVAGDASKKVAIPLVPGDAQGEGIAIGFADASVVAAGWLPTALPGNKLKGDIDESRFAYTSGTSGGSDVTDMGYIAQNMYAVRETGIDYMTEFAQ